ncbi:tRNA preQ1(34) S-adenosylmethionine ribosyltransferase-isomerase QueA [Spirulina major]|uniref:tRNA preQ1(34) S-adenosylmethionine ribosyltransferase-isomerase QueA n=1 Tax=Spirulina major TaxID=270636 RepID=UPI00093370BB|nr:tRNA preQ1(34) S-adenosylmethionine ribosyltransferase-isomerase QueA [Spirulina major]
MALTDHILASYQYELPPERIAQNPVTPRDQSRLLVVDSPDSHVHNHFHQLTDWLKPNDLLVLNNTRVLPARLYGRKSTGAPVEILLLREVRKNCWLALVKPGKRFKMGTEVCFTARTEDGDDTPLWGRVIERDFTTGGRVLEFTLPPGKTMEQMLAKVGYIPFPPYVTETEADPEQYQTVYAKASGSAAAPTAGLHFTPELLDALTAMGVQRTELTLHVGVGTFRPVETEDIRDHRMHAEWASISAETIDKIKETRAKGGRVIAVGTTSVRALEGAAAQQKVGGIRALSEPFEGFLDTFIYPGHQWQIIDGMITNFHLPKSSLLIMISALVGRERLLSLYQDALDHDYRFYSFGDAMLILPDAII